MDKAKILLTGGHGATTGIAIVEEIKKRQPEAQIYWIGSKSVISGSSATSLEHKIYPKLGIHYFSIQAGKLQTKFTRYTIPLVLMIPLGFIQALGLLIRIKPNVVLSLGGFASFPVVFWSWLFGIPVIIHEQTTTAGRASRMEAFFARKIALGRSESLDYFPKNKSVVTGNPLTHSILSVKPKTSLPAKPAILITGGSRGSEFINEEVIKIVPDLVKKYDIYHITGERDYPKYKNLESINYKVFSYVEPSKMAVLYQECDLVIGRAGANSVSELLFVKRPAILIPLPRTYLKEQEKNAKLAEDFGLAKVMLEPEVNPQSLKAEIENIFKNWQNIVKGTLDKPSPDKEASERVCDLIMAHL